MATETAPKATSTARLVDKKVVIVGGSSGIGYAVARECVDHGATVVIASSNPDRVKAAVDRLRQTERGAGANISAYTVDVKDSVELEKFWDKIGHFDHLIWTAGDVTSMDFLGGTLESFKDSMDVRYWAVVMSARYVYKKSLLSPNGSITVTSGVNTKRPVRMQSIAAGGGGAMQAVTRGLAVDLAPIRVNCVCTGAVHTELFERFGLMGDRKEAMLKMIADQTLVKRVGQPEELAEAYLFAMKCAYLTGQTIDVEGGCLLAYKQSTS